MIRASPLQALAAESLIVDPSDPVTARRLAVAA
jgi:hypothetical protein